MEPPLRGEVLRGLAPAASSSCRRCGRPTLALANGRGRLEICEGCGTMEATTTEGLDLFRMKEVPQPRDPGPRREG